MFPRSKSVITSLLLVSLWLQVITPPVMATPHGPAPLASIASVLSKAPGGARQVLATLAMVEQSLVTFLRATFTPQENWNVVLTPVTTEFKDYVAVDYQQSSRKLL